MKLSPAPDSPGPPPPGPPRRGRRGLRAVLVGLAGLAVLAAAGWLALTRPAVGTRFANSLLGRVPALAGAQLSVREVRGDWLSGLELRGLRLARGDTTLVAADTLRARYRLPELLAGRIRVTRLTLSGVAVSAEMAEPRAPEPGRPPLSIPDILRGRFYDGPPLVVDRIALRDASYGGYAGAPDSGWRAADVALAVRDLRLGGGFSLTLDSLSAHLLPPGAAAPWVRAALAGALADGRAELRALRVSSAASRLSGEGRFTAGPRDSLVETRVALRAQPLALRDLRAVLPGLDLEGEVTAEIELRGSRPDRLSGRVRAEAAELRAGELRLGRSRLLAGLRDGRADAALTTVCEAAGLEARGWIRPLDADPAYDLTLRLDRLPSRWPGVDGWAEFARRAPMRTEVHVRGHGYAGAVLDLDGAARGPAGTVALDGRLDASRGLAWEVRRLALTGIDLARLTGDSTASAFDGVLTGHGRVDAPAIAASFRLESEAGALSVAAASARLDGLRPFAIRGARFDHLDLAGLTGNRELASDLSGTFTAAGRLAAPPAVDGHVVLEPSRLRGRAILGGAADLALAGGALTLDAEMASDAGRVAIRAGAHPFDSPPEVVLHEARFADLDLGAWGAGSLPTRLTGRLTAQGRGAGDSRQRLPDAWRATLDLERSRVGTLEIAGGEAEGRLDAGRAEARGRVGARGGAATFTGDASWDAGAAGRPRLAGHAGFTIPFGVLAALAGCDTLPSEGEVRGDLTFSGSGPGDLSATATLAGRGAVATARVDSLFATLRYGGDTVELDTLALRSNVGQAGGAGRITLADSAQAAESDLRFAATLTDLAPLAPLLGADTLALGSGQLEARLAGPPAARRFTVTSSLGSLAWNDIRLLRAGAEAQGTLDRDWRPTAAHAAFEIGRFHSPAAELRQARATGDYAARALRFDLDAELDTKHRVRLAGTATGDSAGQKIVLETADAVADTAQWRLTRPASLRLGRDRLEIVDLEARSASGRLLARGVLDRRGEQDFRCELRGAGLDILSVWLGRPDVTGRLDATLALSGPAAAPRGTGDLRIAAQVDGEPAGELSGEFTWDSGRLRLHTAFASPQDDSLVVTGQLPLALSLAVPDSGARGSALRAFAGDVDLRLSADRFPLRALAPLLPPRTVSALNGTLDADARLAGTGEALTGTGQVTIADGYVALPALGATYQGIRLDGALSGNRLVLREARAASGKGDLRATGELRFASFTHTALDLTVSARRFSFMDTPDLRAVASGDLRVTGTPTAPRITGRAVIAGSYYYLTEAAIRSAQAKPPVPLTPTDVRMLEENFGYLAAPAADPALAFYDASDLDLQIRLERDTWVRQRSTPRFSVEVTGDVHLQKRPHGEPELSGRLEPVPEHGYVEQFGRSFDLAGGEVLLNGGMAEHTVDIRAEYKTRSPSGSGEPDVVVRLEVQGRVDKLKLTLSSEPAMSETDIVSYIATGRTPPGIQSASGSTNQSGSLAAGIGMSQLTGPLEDVVQEKTGLDVMQVRYDAQQGATLVAGRYVDPVLYLGFRQPLQYHDTGTTESSNPYRTRFEVEYEALQWLVFNLQGEIDLLRAFLRGRYAY